jgi:hypothetical protein
MSTLSQEDYRAKIEHVGDNIYIAHRHLEIHEKMTDMMNERRPEYPEFFRWSRMAHYDAGVLRLVRAYDHDSLGLLKVVRAFQSNYRFWDIESDNDRRDLNQEIEADKSFLQEDPLVMSLKHLRDKSIAHTANQLYPQRLSFSLEEIFEGEVIFRDYEITTEEIDRLPPNEKKMRLFEANQRLFEALRKENNMILGGKIPQFNELLSLSKKGLEICRKYMTAVGINSINTEVNGL